MRHLLHREWQTTYCGENPQGLHMTSTVSLAECPRCMNNLRLLADIVTSTPDQFREDHQ